MSIADDFNKKLETTIAIALKESWDKNNPELKKWGYAEPGDPQFKQWAKELISDRSISLTDPSGEVFKVDINILQGIVNQNPQARKVLKEQFETDELNKIIPTSEQQAKIGEALESAKESSTGLWAMLANIVMGFIDWLMGGFQSGQDGNLFSGLTEAISRRGASRFATEADSQLASVPDLQPGIRKYIVQEAYKKAERNDAPERTLADVTLGEKLSSPTQNGPALSAQPETSSTVSTLTEPAVEPGKIAATEEAATTPPAPAKVQPAVAPEADGDQTKLRGVVQNIMRNILAKNEVVGAEMEKALKDATPVVMKAINSNAHLIEERKFDELASNVAQNLLNDNTVGATLRKKGREKYGIFATDSNIVSKIEADIKAELNPNTRAQLQSSIPSKVASADNPHYGFENLGNFSPEASGKLPGGERYI